MTENYETYWNNNQTTSKTKGNGNSQMNIQVGYISTISDGFMQSSKWKFRTNGSTYPFLQLIGEISVAIRGTSPDIKSSVQSKMVDLSIFELKQVEFLQRC